MKRIIFFAALSALFFTACEKKEQAPVNHNNEVAFVIDGPVTRVTTTDNVTSFTSGDVISITSVGLSEDVINEPYTVTDNGLEGKTVTFDGAETASFIAHYPTSLTYADGKIEMTVPSVQNEENFHANMFMVAQAEGNSTAPEVKLSFTHQLAWVKLVLEGIEGTAVTLNNIVPTVTWTASASTVSGIATDIVAWKQGETQVYWALVPAQEVAAGSKVVTIATADKTYEYTLDASLVLTTAKVKTITLSVKEDDPSAVEAAISVDTTDPAEWTDDTDLSGNLNEVEIPAIEVISAEEGNLANVAELITGATGWTTIKTDGWNAVINGEGTVEVNAEEGCVDLTAVGDWYRTALAFRTPTAVKAGKYILSVNAKSESAGEMRYVIIDYSGTVINNALYQATTTDYPETPYDKTLELSADYSGLIVAITTKTPAGVKYSIKNVTLVEVKE